MDIVKTLLCMDEAQFYDAPATAYADCQRAAEEIKRLRKENAVLRACFGAATQGWSYDQLGKAMSDAEAFVTGSASQ